MEEPQILDPLATHHANRYRYTRRDPPELGKANRRIADHIYEVLTENFGNASSIDYDYGLWRSR